VGAVYHGSECAPNVPLFFVLKPPLSALRVRALGDNNGLEVPFGTTIIIHKLEIL
jgi:hypothetical protein